jgi:hypothetical protein
MQIYEEKIRVKGKDTKVPAIQINNKVVIIQGKYIKTARINDEWLEDVEDPEAIIRALKDSKVKADIFTFYQRLPETKPKYNYFMEWDNVAAIPIKSFDHWFKNQIHQNTRNKVRKAKKKGVEVKCTDFNDEFVKRISNIYNETPIRQGKPFWHYEKDFETLKMIHSTFLDKSDFIGAYYNDEMIGFIKLVFAGKYTRTMHVLSMVKHRDKAPINILMAKAVEICENKKIPFLVYGSFDYGKRGRNSLTNFKRYNGFEKILLPRYYIPLTIKGKIILKLNLQHGAVDLLPEKIITRLINIRERWYKKKYSQ